jgi:NADH-quinone oxidoreductase subunit M
MILLWLILIPFVGGLVAWLLARWNTNAPRWISLFASAIELVLALALWGPHERQAGLSPHGPWLVQWDQPWVPQWGIRFHLGVDGLSLLLVMLTAFLGIMAVVCSWTEIQERVGFFHFSLMWVLSGITGVFLALDLFLFYFCW